MESHGQVKAEFACLSSASKQGPSSRRASGHASWVPALLGTAPRCSAGTRAMTLARGHAGDLAADTINKRDELRAAAVACGAHALHDGYTDLIYVLLPV